MEIRNVNMDERTITGVCAPYDEISYLVPDPNGERIMRGAFNKSLRQRSDKVLLFRGHDHNRAVARSRAFSDNDAGLVGIFHARPSLIGDEALEEARDGYLPGMSVGFRPLQERRAADGAREIVEAALLEVSLVTIPAYEGAAVLAVRGRAEESLAFAPVVLDDGPPLMPWWAS
jgi:hypothetical protein